MVGPASIAIVTISFNQARFLRECIESVLAQKRPGVDRYVVVDPGSTDGSRQLIEQYRGAIDHIVFEPDQGPADGLNNGFRLATGEFFGYLNADDRLSAGTLDFVRTYFAGHSEVDVLCGAIRIIDAEGRASVRKRTADHFEVARYVAGVCTVGQQATFFRRDAFVRAGGFNVANRISWDGELLVDMALGGANFATVPKVLGDFRIYPESISGSGAHLDKLHAEHRRVGEKARARGVRLYSDGTTRLLRLLYKFNALRHMRYLLVR